MGWNSKTIDVRRIYIISKGDGARVELEEDEAVELVEKLKMIIENELDSTVESPTDVTEGRTDDDSTEKTDNLTVHQEIAGRNTATPAEIVEDPDHFAYKK